MYSQAKHEVLVKSAGAVIEPLGLIGTDESKELQRSITRDIDALHTRKSAVEVSNADQVQANSLKVITDKNLRTVVEACLGIGEVSKLPNIAAYQQAFDRGDDILSVAEPLEVELGKLNPELGKPLRAFLAKASHDALKANATSEASTHPQQEADGTWTMTYRSLSALVQNALGLIETNGMPLPGKARKRRSPEEVQAEKDRQDAARKARIAKRLGEKQASSPVAPVSAPQPAAPPMQVGQPVNEAVVVALKPAA